MNPQTSNLADDLIRIHKVITRGINVSLVKGREYLQAGIPHPQTLAGYSSYVHCLVSVLDSHHTGEDIVAFPKLRTLIPSAPYAKLAADHQHVEGLLAPMPAAIEALSDQTQKELLEIVESLRKISEVWEPHIQLEEHYFSAPALNAVMSLEDQKQLSEEFGKHSQEHSGPPNLVVPFVLYNLEHEDRAVMAAGMPATITEELVPKVWASQWAPMKPLLLD